jgi:hypothetical protein
VVEQWTVLFDVRNRKAWRPTGTSSVDEVVVNSKHVLLCAQAASLYNAK